MPATRPNLAGRSVASSILIFALNAWICRELFTADFVNNLLSNEGIFAALGRFFREHPIDHRWFPWFNVGMATEYAYQPLLPAMAAVTGALTGWPASRSLHFVLAFAYCCGPVTLFWLAWDWSESLALSLSAALAFSADVARGNARSVNCASAPMPTGARCVSTTSSSTAKPRTT